MSKKVKEEPKQGAPAFIVTFSDMVTLLLTFFVMLLSLADDKVNDFKFMEGISSFKMAVADFGLSGAMYNKGTGPEFEFNKIRYKTPKEEETPQERKETQITSKDHHTEMLRRTIMDIEQMMKVSPSQISGDSKIFIVTTLRFGPGEWEMNAKMEQELNSYSLQIHETLRRRQAMLYVVGIAGDVDSMRSQYMVSSKRAAAVAEYLKTTFPAGVNWPVYSWGAGAGGEWIGEDGLISGDGQILLAMIIRE